MIGTSVASSASNSVIPPSPLIDIDGNVYNTVTIGTQVWMAENLKTTTNKYGVPISNVTDNTVWGQLTTAAYSDYSNTPVISTIYGKLYNWYAVNTGNLCPTGWHVPTDDEWTTLTTYLGGEAVAGKLKETGTTHWQAPNTGATNETGFTALPGGYRDYTGTYYIYINVYGFWWSTTVYSGLPTNSWYRYMGNTDPFVERSNFNKRYGFSVRCLKN